ncbi:Piso0_001139 [Millerozyma farinosa CBS 7064]|uniref:Piso0_001139 protein n=1 Tax=Pichia sorbitophila (strain ATCC MYA-4447 / BCRC 22081 / CBS 7064 / NBRC 10061 / NRRL Y-12695) TaxID=559304 RepID=G8YPC9_PICSO|nr:Piso0_001139 [Millerozyma farinosa CBS 7064]CCE79100.1 Piso0_001139 [Millerozyma farinosa CBS 7064]
MASRATVIGSVVGTVLGVSLLISVLLFCYVFCCCVVFLEPEKEYSLTELKYRHSHKAFASNKKKSLRIFSWYRQKKNKEDIESQIDINKPPSSIIQYDTGEAQSVQSELVQENLQNEIYKPNMNDRILLPDNKFSHVSNEGDLYIIGDFRDSDNTPRKISGIHSVSDYTTPKMNDQTINAGFDSTITTRVPDGINFNAPDQYDSFTRTLMLQNIVNNANKNTNEFIIREVKDPFSKNNISMGGIVVVVKPFRGKYPSEFTFLQTGDLLRVVKFYIKEPQPEALFSTESKALNITRPSTSSIVAEHSGEENESQQFYRNYDLCIDETNQHYRNVYCTGILLNTYLDFDNKTRDFALKFKKDSIRENEFEILKDFPLNVVSLETTILRTMAESLSVNNDLATD